MWLPSAMAHLWVRSFAFQDVRVCRPRRAAGTVIAEPAGAATVKDGSLHRRARASSKGETPMRRGIEMAEEQTAPAGWYPDTDGVQLRWWDGSAWTAHVTPAPQPDATPELTLIVERKRVYSHDMLYVADADGVKVGQVNLGSGKVTMDQPDLRAAFDQCVERWRADHPGPTPTPEVPVIAEAPMGSTGDVVEPPSIIEAATPTEPVQTDPVWQDLSHNRAGQAVRERAVDLRGEAPVKTFVARVFGVHTDERAYRVGADGEEAVAWRMRKLGDGWHVIHSVPVGEKGSDIDHVVIGPAGVFTLNTKNHSSKKVWVAEKAFLVSGQKTNYLRNSRHEAARASKLLTDACGFDVPVKPIIVVMAAELNIKAQPADVHVVPRKRIGKWLQRRPSTLSPPAVESIYEMARRDTTWQPR